MCHSWKTGFLPFLASGLWRLYTFSFLITFFSFFLPDILNTGPFPDLTVITNRRWKIYVPPYQSHLQNLSFHLKIKIKLLAFKGCRDNLLYVNWSTTILYFYPPLSDFPEVHNCSPWANGLFGKNCFTDNGWLVFPKWNTIGFSLLIM